MVCKLGVGGAPTTINILYNNTLTLNIVHHEIEKGYSERTKKTHTQKVLCVGTVINDYSGNL